MQINEIIDQATQRVKQDVISGFRRDFKKFKKAGLNLSEKMSEKTLMLMFIDYWHLDDEDMPTIELKLEDLNITTREEVIGFCKRLKQETATIEYTSDRGVCTCIYNVFNACDFLEEQNKIELQISREFVITIEE